MRASRGSTPASRIDGLDRSIDVRFEVMAKQAATNLEIVLTAFQGLADKIKGA